MAAVNHSTSMAVTGGTPPKVLGKVRLWKNGPTPLANRTVQEPYNLDQDPNRPRLIPSAGIGPAPHRYPSHPSAMSTKSNVDVLIIGAGPAGLMCANGLARAGVNVRIIDQR
jgi:NADPH-dependent 2,4-dienoyl-CoA reductase/sulfur reductase-like enzyme